MKTPIKYSTPTEPVDLSRYDTIISTRDFNKYLRSVKCTELRIRYDHVGEDDGWLMVQVLNQ